MVGKNYWILFILLCINLLAFGQVTFIIESLPKTTPQDDTIFIAGSFNNWAVNNPDYILKKQLDGRLAITLPIYADTIEYKFCRGSWMKVETNKENQYIPNRIFTNKESNIVYIQISNWQDSGGLKPTHYIVYYFFASAFLAIFLLFLAYRIQRLSYPRFIGFLVINIIIIVLLLGSFLYNETNLIWQSYISVLAQSILYVWGPALYLFVLTFQDQKIASRIFFHFIPSLLIFVFNILRILNLQVLGFMTYKINPYLTYGDALIIWISILINIIYHIRISGYIISNLKNEDKNTSTHSLISVICFISTIALVLLIVDNILIVTGIRTKIVINHELVLIAVTLIIFSKTYFLWRYPEVMQERTGQYIIENVEGLKDRLENLMQNEKSYRNPDLNVANLSEILDTKPHILSKILNDHFHKGFRDYINKYRVEEFIHLANSEDYKNLTFLALAHEVGFNSKSTFNLAFKKVTKRSPREFFKKS